MKDTPSRKNIKLAFPTPVLQPQPCGRSGQPAQILPVPRLKQGYHTQPSQLSATLHPYASQTTDDVPPVSMLCIYLSVYHVLLRQEHPNFLGPQTPLFILHRYYQHPPDHLQAINERDKKTPLGAVALIIPPREALHATEPQIADSLAF
jgi:hypothetical protein